MRTWVHGENNPGKERRIRCAPHKMMRRFFYALGGGAMSLPANYVEPAPTAAAWIPTPLYGAVGRGLWPLQGCNSARRFQEQPKQRRRRETFAYRVNPRRATLATSVTRWRPAFRPLTREQMSSKRATIGRYPTLPAARLGLAHFHSQHWRRVGNAIGGMKTAGKDVEVEALQHVRTVPSAFSNAPAAGCAATGLLLLWTNSCAGVATSPLRRFESCLVRFLLLSDSGGVAASGLMRRNLQQRYKTVKTCTQPCAAPVVSVQGGESCPLLLIFSRQLSPVPGWGRRARSEAAGVPICCGVVPAERAPAVPVQSPSQNGAHRTDPPMVLDGRQGASCGCLNETPQTACRYAALHGRMAKGTLAFVFRIVLRTRGQRALADTQANRGQTMSGPRFGSAIKYPSRPSEFDIQAFVYSALVEKGVDVHGEVTAKAGGSKFDLVVFVDQVAVRIIEIKRSKSLAKATLTSEQVSRYAQYGIGVDVVGSMKQARNYVAAFQIDSEPMVDPAAPISNGRRVKATPKPGRCSCLTTDCAPCTIRADRQHDGRPYCHVHDPAGKYQRQLRAKHKGNARVPLRSRIGGGSREQSRKGRR